MSLIRFNLLRDNRLAWELNGKFSPLSELGLPYLLNMVMSGKNRLHPSSLKENTMQKIQEIMTRDVMTVSPKETIRRAAQMMDELNVGAIPVCDGQKLVGMITDRDIVVRAIAVGNAPESTYVGDVMSTDVRWCYDDQPVDEVMEEMRDVQIRRIPVMDHNTRNMVGIVSLGDLATKHSAEVDRTLEKISYPSEPDRPQLNS
jgi:CBS domain-containing protein